MSKEREGGDVISVDFTAKREDVATTILPHRKNHPSFMRITMGGVQVACGHSSILIDEDTLDLECADCKEPIDARLFVMEWAKRLRSLQWSREAVDRLRAERDKLQQEVKNLKAAKRRALKGTP